MTYNTPYPAPVPGPAAKRRPLGLPFVALVGLAALGLPRVVLHDLHVIDQSNPLNAILALAPVVIWIWVALARRVANPFLTLLVTGALFGVMLVVTHQLLWTQAYSGDLPALGDGSLATTIPRLAAIPSGLFTGALIGAVGGLIAWGIQAAMRSRRDR
jgi:hypothetical protein